MLYWLLGVLVEFGAVVVLSSALQMQPEQKADGRVAKKEGEDGLQVDACALCDKRERAKERGKSLKRLS